MQPCRLTKAGRRPPAKSRILFNSPRLHMHVGALIRPRSTPAIPSILGKSQWNFFDIQPNESEATADINVLSATLSSGSTK